MFFKLLTSLVLAQLAVGQDYGGGAPAATSAAPAAAQSAPPNTPGHINIDVAPNGNFVFNPANVTANVGDLVTFFIPGGSLAHSVTQSSFASPCTYLAANGSSPAGFDSRLQTAKTFTINITDTKPIWFHCKQITHCGLGMVGSINAPTNGTNTHAAFVAAAIAIGSKEIPEVDTPGGSPVLTGLSAVATGPPVDSTGSNNADALRSVGKMSLYFTAVGIAMLLI